MKEINITGHIFLNFKIYISYIYEKFRYIFRKFKAVEMQPSWHKRAIAES
jgi:hypothetical protein